MFQPIKVFFTKKTNYILFCTDQNMDGERISCRGFNPMIPNSMMEDHWRIAVMCKFIFIKIYNPKLILVNKNLWP